MITPDPVHEQAMRELIVGLLQAYGVKRNLDVLDNGKLKIELEKAISGITTEKGPGA